MTDTTTTRRRGRPPGSISTRRPPVFTVDDRGHPVALVPLANGAGAATVDRPDWEALMARGVSPNWSLQHTGDGPSRFPLVKAPNGGGKMVAVARLILNATARARVVFATKDRLDLRRSNISLKTCNARGEGDADTGRQRAGKRTDWTSIAKGPTKAQQAAERRAACDAAHAAFQAASSERYARWMAWIESQVAAGRDRQEVMTEAQEQARAERRAYCVQYGLDPQTGRFPRVVKGHKVEALTPAVPLWPTAGTRCAAIPAP